MRTVLCLSVLAALAAQSAFADSNNSIKCDLEKIEIPLDWKTMEVECVTKVKEQVQEELTAAMTYLAMGAYFSKDTVNRHGFAQLFFSSASEEREHAVKLLEYLLMRGELTKDIDNVILKANPLKEEWSSPTSALKDALELEAHVTRKIRAMIKTCERGINDFHFVDYLTGEFLDEQHKGSRDLAGKLSTLGKMTRSNGQLAEFLFDKKLLNGEV